MGMNAVMEPCLRSLAFNYETAAVAEIFPDDDRRSGFQLFIGAGFDLPGAAGEFHRHHSRRRAAGRNRKVNRPVFADEIDGVDVAGLLHFEQQRNHQRGQEHHQESAAERDAEPAPSEMPEEISAPAEKRDKGDNCFQRKEIEPGDVLHVVCIDREVRAVGIDVGMKPRNAHDELEDENDRPDHRDKEIDVAGARQKVADA